MGFDTDNLVYDRDALKSLCSIFDNYYIADKKIMLDKEYLSVSSLIYSDGSYTKKVYSDGYVHIRDLKDAEYLMFIDQNRNIYLAVYKYISSSKMEDIELRYQELTNRMYNDDDHTKDTYVSNQDKDTINMEDPKCTECGNDLITCSPKNNGFIITRCQNCKLEFVLKPDKYYTIVSKTKYYN